MRGLNTQSWGYFLTALGFFTFFPFKTAAGQAAAPGGRVLPAIPSRQVQTYSSRTTTKYLNDENHTVEITLVFLKGEKEQWNKIVAYPITKTLIDKETGRVFCEIDYPLTGEIKAYTVSGVKILDLKGRLLAVSMGGRFMAYRPPEREAGLGGGTVFVVEAGRSSVLKFKVGKDFAVKAVTGDGKHLLVGTEESSPSRADYSLVDGEGKKIWEIKGLGQFHSLESHGQRVLFSRSREKTVDYYDMETGKLLNVMPLWKFTALHNPPPQKTP
jgi:hypothetical protein